MPSLAVAISAQAAPLSLFPLLMVGLGGAVLMLTLWAVARRTRNAANVDLGWSTILGAAAVYYALVGPGAPVQRALAGCVGGLWGARLSWHLLRDRVVGKPEDGRYAAMRQAFGARANLHFLWFFLAQAALALALSLPFWLLSHCTAPRLAGVQWVGLVCFVLGWAGESLADRQLAAFRADPRHRGQTCDRGLWRYSRHPNYFCEWVMWVAFALLAWPAPFGAWCWLAPLLMYVLITRVTGIPYNEAQALRTRGDAYRAYQRTTNAFFPGPRRRAAAD